MTRICWVEAWKRCLTMHLLRLHGSVRSWVCVVMRWRGRVVSTKPVHSFVVVQNLTRLMDGWMHGSMLGNIACAGRVWALEEA
jgi:hypothetical protein